MFQECKHAQDTFTDVIIISLKIISTLLLVLKYRAMSLKTESYTSYTHFCNCFNFLYISISHGVI